MLATLETGRGTENVALNLIRYKPEDMDIVIIEPNFSDGKRISKEEINTVLTNVKVIKVDLHIAKGSTKLEFLFNLFIRRAILRDLKEIQKTKVYKEIRDTDIVYLFYNLYSVFFSNLDIPIIGSQHTDSLKIFEIHNNRNFLYNFYHILVRKLYYKNINGLHVFPNKRHLLNNQKLKYKMELPIGVDTSLYCPNYNSKNKRIKFLFNAALTRPKGLDLLLPLIDRLKWNPDIEFHVAGTGELEETIGMNPNIIYHGVPSNLELARLYGDSDIFIYPTRSDAYPAVILQALSSGLYVLCSDYLKGIFDDFEGKYLEYLPRNVNAFYNRIVEITKDINIIKHDKEEEYIYVKNNYDWQIISKRFYQNIRTFKP